MEPISAWHFYPAKDFTSRLRRGLTVADSSAQQPRAGWRFSWAHLQSNTWAPAPWTHWFLVSHRSFQPGLRARVRGRWRREGVLGWGVREILIKRRGFTRPGCSFFGDPVNESYEGGRRRRAECFLLKPEIRKSDRPNTLWCRVFSLLSISLCLYEGWRWGLGQVCTVELITQYYPLRKHFAALIAQFRTAGGRGSRQSLTPFYCFSPL